MSNQTINQNYIAINDPTLKDLLDLYQKQIMINFNCHHLGTIQNFNSSNQTAQVTVNYRKTYFVFEENTSNFVSKTIDYPILADCPVIVLGGGTTRITFPISKGDQCILLFNDRDIDNWFQGSLNSPNATPRLHHISDAIVLIGPNNKSTVISNYDTIRAIITNGTVKNGINPQTNKLTLTNGTSLNTLLQNLCTQLENLTTAIAAITVSPGSFNISSVPVSGVSGTPINASSITSIGTNISNIAINISQLIE